jgi:tRNA-dihydrouridine synthase A|tara:strand:- start:6041 stop:7027 length:987 start_codon:yes stop_codon:yes gene_type:complete
MITDAHKFCIAPMMKKTDKHFRFLARQFTRRAMLYTEMIHANAILKGNVERLLGYDDCEHPVGLQLGGSEPKALAEAAIIGQEYGYDEINLNVGCPSKKVKSGNFGVFLMKNVKLLSSCINEVKKNIDIPFSIKCRIGVDDFEGEEYLREFIATISDHDIDTFVIHARKAISGLDTKRNRSIPPLNYDLVFKMKELFPNLKIIINGGIEEISEVKKLLNSVDGVMLGRKIYSDPAFLLQVDKEIYQEDTRLDFATGMQKYMSYILKLENKKDANRAITHLVQIIRRISHTKDVRKKLLDNVKNGSVELDEIFDGFKEDLSQRAHLQIH